MATSRSTAGTQLDSGLDAQTRDMLGRLQANPFLDPMNMTPAQMRQAFDAFYAPIDLPSADVEIINTVFEGPVVPIRLRLYRPRVRTEPVAVVLYYKGGGLIMGTLDSYDRICRRLCEASGALVVSVDYRQPPENRYPAAVDDCYAALVWTQGAATGFGGDASRLAVVGESGGGLLAAVITHRAHDLGGPRIRYQVLIYPAVGTRGASQSMKDFARGYWFEPEQLEWLYGQYISNSEQMHDPGVVAILREDFSELPPAYVVVANFDILRDDIEDYARRLADAGVPVEVRRYPTTIHGFMNMGGVIDFVGEALDECGARIATALAAPKAPA